MTERVTPEQMAEWKALADAATEGPWLYRPQEYDDWGYVRVHDGAVVAIGRAGQYVGEEGYAAHRSNGTDPYGNNARFTAAARTAVPALIAEVERLRGRVYRMQEALTPSADTKATYIGEFSHRVTSISDDGEEQYFDAAVPWPTIKEIMAAIRARSTLPEDGQ